MCPDSLSLGEKHSKSWSDGHWSILMTHPSKAFSSRSGRDSRGLRLILRVAAREPVALSHASRRVRKWQREVEESARPPCRHRRLDRRQDKLERLRIATRTGPLFAIMSRERANLAYR